VQQDVADPFAGSGTARLSRQDDLAAMPRQSLSKTARLERFAGALASFKGEEEAALHR
jgi:hypothetical protein